MHILKLRTELLPWLSWDLADALIHFDSYRDPFGNTTDYTVADGQYQIMLSRFPELSGHMRRWPRPPVARHVAFAVTIPDIGQV